MIRNEYYDDYPTDEPHELNGRRRRKRRKKRKSRRSSRRAKRRTRKKARKTKRKARRSKRRTRRRKKGGIFKRVWRGIKRFNPATIAMRNGILVAAKINLKKMSSRLRYGYLTPTQAQRLGVDMSKHQKIKRTLSKLERKFKKIGGKTKNLKKAILKGRGNRDRKIPLSGFSSEQEFVPNFANKELLAIENVLTKYENKNFDADKLLETANPPANIEGVNGALGVATASVIAAATPVLIALMNMMKKSGVATEQDMYPEEPEYDDYGYEEEYGEEEDYGY